MVRAHATRVVYQGQVGYESGSAEKWQQVPNAGHKKRRGGEGKERGAAGAGVSAAAAATVSLARAWAGRSRGGAWQQPCR